MNNNKQKLELTWIGKNNPEYDIANIEPRILEENPELSNCKNDPNTENMIIHGDNLLALKALLPEYEGKIKCIFIDPPYNTGSAFKLYDDGVEHSTWLSLMKPRLELLRSLLTENGSIYVAIDFNETHYLKILMDEVFGRECFQREIIWRMGWLSGFKTVAKNYIRNHDSILYYTKNANNFYFNKIKAYTTKDDYVERFNAEQVKTIQEKLTQFGLSKKDSKEFSNFISTIGLPERYPLEDTWNCGQYDKLNSINVVSFAGEKVSKMLGVTELKGQKSEALIKRILTISTEPGDFVLDSFLGTGTTCAVSHKMNRKYIGIEMGDHAYTHTKARLDKVVDGSDQSGISKAVKWEGGGAYKFYELAPSFIIKDEFGNPVIDDFYDDAKLIKVMCKLMNFTYQPSKSEYWKHGIGQGKSYLYVTTQLLTSGMVQQIAQHLTAGESLIICPKKYEPGAEKIDNRITVKKIPQSILKACHFGKKEYLLPVKETAIEEVDNEAEDDDN